MQWLCRLPTPISMQWSASSVLSSSRTRRNPTARCIAYWLLEAAMYSAFGTAATTGMASSPTMLRPDSFPTDPPQFYRVGLGYNKIDPIKDSLSDAGFIDLRIAVLTREKQVSDIGAFARALVYGNPLIDMIRTRGGVDPDQVVNALGEALARELGDPARLPLRAILFEATKP